MVVLGLLVTSLWCLDIHIPRPAQICTHTHYHCYYGRGRAGWRKVGQTNDNWGKNVSAASVLPIEPPCLCLRSKVLLGGFRYFPFSSSILFIGQGYFLSPTTPLIRGIYLFLNLSFYIKRNCISHYPNKNHLKYVSWRWTIFYLCSNYASHLVKNELKCALSILV